MRLLLQGCRCKKGCCTKRCSCFKADVKCGPGCRCTNCENLPSSRSQPNEPDDNEVEQELQDDLSLRLTYNSELVDDVHGADTASDHEQDEILNLSEDD